MTAPAGAPRVFTAADDDPDFGPGTVVAVHYGDYRRQEIWVVSGTNIGNMYPLGGEFGRPRQAADPRPLSEQILDPHGWTPEPGLIPLHPVWADVVARGPVTVLVAAQDETWTAAWQAGRLRLYQQIETLRDEEDWPPAHHPEQGE